jgi:uncharacterized damage-inducible protein DinB
MPAPEEQLSRMSRTAEDLAAALRTRPEAVARRPAENSWAAIEVLCHLRDTEDLFLSRFQAILAENEPKLSGPPDNERMTAERQYLKDDAPRALETFRAKRQANLKFLRGLTPAQLERGGTHPTRGRMTIKDFVAVMASHDDNHLEQLRRALDGKP